ncbi:MAG: hypothetical protein JO184_18000 [Gammaproteobacteria bacterium]|nr:hypothetical protein [Gammaproteobacteria bacterium]MBV8306188.1 hypothetical protein [Gammaproteobacteria bacterium]MBV8402801.1 hypothetical protein [Gammaproteobacteria bacterium]
MVLLLTGCHQAPGGGSDSPAIVGAWIVRAPEAPFPVHMFVFHSDGTVQQSNPDAGDPATSDSNLMGVWVRDGEGFRGKAIEITADRATHLFVSRGEISFALKVSGNAFTGTARAVFYDANGQRIKGPVQARLEGERVLP